MEERVGERRRVGSFGLPLFSVLSPLLRPPSAVVHHLVSDPPWAATEDGSWREEENSRKLRKLSWIVVVRIDMDQKWALLTIIIRVYPCDSVAKI
jgi:hypothetical protein